MSTHSLLPKWLAAAAIAIGLAAAPAAGQVVTRSSAQEDPRSAPLPSSFDPAAFGLNTEPLIVDGLGLEIHLPTGSKVITDPAGGRPTVTVQEGAQPARWSMRIQRVSGILGGPPQTPQTHIAAYLRRLDAAGVPYRVLRDEALVCRGLEGHVCYLEQSSPDGQRYVSGWLAMPTGSAPGTGEPTMLEFSILTLPEHVDSVTPLLDRSFSTIGIRSARAVESERRQMLASGQAVLESLTPARLRQLVGFSRWYRIYIPAEPGNRAGDQELGYSLVEITQARKGELNPERDESLYTAAEDEAGLLVKVQGRVVVDVENESYYDSLGLYWLAWDQSSEAWSVRATHRVGDTTNSESETGVRAAPAAGEPLPRITVIRAAAESFRRQPHEWSVPDVYLSQALVWVLGRLLPRTADSSMEMGYYVYSGAGDPSITLRQDTWRPAGNGTGDWILSTRQGGDRAATESVYDVRGNLVRRTRVDRSVTEPISPASLKRLWQSRGLPMGRTGR
ncbi:MAG: hypothetical protein ACYTJ0_19705 [Planctomycetota bacterium]|jgi:hypothetical protein